MTLTCKIDSLPSDGLQLPLKITIGSKEITDTVTICIPNESKDEKIHILAKNGHNTGVKGSPQQIVCLTCGKSFYLHTSRFFKDMKNDIRSIISQSLKRGRLNAKSLSKRLQMKKSTISRLFYNL
ncbi:hypothetical protein [Candidatus Harpocratesius sp.]